MTLGFGIQVDNGLLPLWDDDEMAKIKLADGRSFETLAKEIQTAAALSMSEFLADPLYGNFISVQTDVEVEYPIGSTNGITELGEFETPDPQKGKTTGHSIGLKDWTRALGWSIFGLEDRSTAKLEADIGSVIQDIRDHLRQRALTRLFTMEGWTVGTTANANVPLADGGTTDATYIPPKSKNGNTFLATHNHFLRHAALNDANFLLALDTLVEHGEPGPYDVIASSSDLATWVGLTGFKSPLWEGVAYQSSATERMPGMEPIMNYIGAIETRWGISRIWATPRVPTNYYALYKSMGNMNPQNPVRLRYDERKGLGYKLVPGKYVNNPMTLAVLHGRYEYGIGPNRTNGVCVYIAGAGNYVTPTIT